MLLPLAPGTALISGSLLWLISGGYYVDGAFNLTYRHVGAYDMWTTGEGSVAVAVSSLVSLVFNDDADKMKTHLFLYMRYGTLPSTPSKVKWSVCMQGSVVVQGLSFTVACVESQRFWWHDYHIDLSIKVANQNMIGRVGHSE